MAIFLNPFDLVIKSRTGIQSRVFGKRSSIIIIFIFEEYETQLIAFGSPARRGGSSRRRSFGQRTEVERNVFSGGRQVVWWRWVFVGKESVGEEILEMEGLGSGGGVGSGSGAMVVVERGKFDVVPHFFHGFQGR